MRRALALSVCALAVSLSACESDDSRRILLDQLASRETLWAQNGSASYSIEMTRQCSCEDESRIWQVRLDVENGEVVAGEHVFTQEPLTAAELALQYDVEDLFALVRDALNRGVASISISYDTEFGFIDMLLIDYDARRSTDDIFITVEAYTPAGTGGP